MSWMLSASDGNFSQAWLFSWNFLSFSSFFLRKKIASRKELLKKRRSFELLSHNFFHHHHHLPSLFFPVAWETWIEGLGGRKEKNILMMMNQRKKRERRGKGRWEERERKRRMQENVLLLFVSDAISLLWQQATAWSRPYKKSSWSTSRWSSSSPS